MCRLETSGKSPMGMIIPPLRIRIHNEIGIITSLDKCKIKQISLETPAY